MTWRQCLVVQLALEAVLSNHVGGVIHMPFRIMFLARSCKGKTTECIILVKTKIGTPLCLSLHLFCPLSASTKKEIVRYTHPQLPSFWVELCFEWSSIVTNKRASCGVTWRHKSEAQKTMTAVSGHYIYQFPNCAMRKKQLIESCWFCIFKYFLLKPEARRDQLSQTGTKHSH